jgi:crotonobetainyl-CoA:carnitine CoA-transferase CaiB-like acyl-CoA transferase
VEAHRTEIALGERTGTAHDSHGRRPGALYDVYLSSDGLPVLLGALEPRFWVNLCAGMGRPDLVHHHGGATIEWQRRCTAWGWPGARTRRRGPRFASREQGRPGRRSLALAG